MNVKEYRIKKGYSQKQIAEMLNIKQSSYSCKENGKRGFTANEIKKLKDILKVSYEDLLN